MEEEKGPASKEADQIASAFLLHYLLEKGGDYR